MVTKREGDHLVKTENKRPFIKTELKREDAKINLSSIPAAPGVALTTALTAVKQEQSSTECKPFGPGTALPRRRFCNGPPFVNINLSSFYGRHKSSAQAHLDRHRGTVLLRNLQIPPSLPGGPELNGPEDEICRQMSSRGMAVGMPTGPIWTFPKDKYGFTMAFGVSLEPLYRPLPPEPSVGSPSPPPALVPKLAEEAEKKPVLTHESVPKLKEDVEKKPVLSDAPFGDPAGALFRQPSQLANRTYFLGQASESEKPASKSTEIVSEEKTAWASFNEYFGQPSQPESRPSTLVQASESKTVSKSTEIAPEKKPVLSRTSFHDFLAGASFGRTSRLGNRASVWGQALESKKPVSGSTENVPEKTVSTKTAIKECPLSLPGSLGVPEFGQPSALGGRFSWGFALDQASDPKKTPSMLTEHKKEPLTKTEVDEGLSAKHLHTSTIEENLLENRLPTPGTAAVTTPSRRRAGAALLRAAQLSTSPSAEGSQPRKFHSELSAPYGEPSSPIQGYGGFDTESEHLDTSVGDTSSSVEPDQTKPEILTKIEDDIWIYNGPPHTKEEKSPKKSDQRKPAKNKGVARGRLSAAPVPDIPYPIIDISD